MTLPTAKVNFTAEEYDAYVRAKLAEEADMLALDERYEEGIEKGRKEEKIILAKSFLKAGASLEITSNATGFSIAELEKLRLE